jgi:hypothetical protein
MSAVLMFAPAMAVQELFRSDVKPTFRAVVQMEETAETAEISGLKLTIT